MDEHNESGGYQHYSIASHRIGNLLVLLTAVASSRADSPRLATLCIWDKVYPLFGVAQSQAHGTPVSIISVPGKYQYEICIEDGRCANQFVEGVTLIAEGLLVHSASGRARAKKVTSQVAQVEEAIRW